MAALQHDLGRDEYGNDDTGNGLGSFTPSDPLGGDPNDPNSGDDTGPGYESDPLGGNPNDPTAPDDTDDNPYGDNDSGGDNGGGGGDGGGAGKMPLVLDLDGDGVELVALEDSTAFFDINGDGYRERMGWASADDGFLAYDKDGDGVISEHDELSFVSYVEGAQTDLEGLAHFDTNDDGVLDAKDAEWGKFRVWRDLDQDGESDAGELQTLDEAGISSISLTSDGVEREVEGHTVFGEGTYTHDDGDRAFFDAALQHSAWGIREDADGNITVGSGEDAVLHIAGPTTEAVRELDAAALGVAGIIGHDTADRLTAAAGGSLLIGAGGDDELVGGAGDDWLQGDGGADRISGGGGSDILVVDAEDFATGAVDGGAGFDIAMVSGDAGVTVDLATHGLEAVLGGDGNDTFSTSGAAGVVLFGEGGNDTITGGEGGDVLSGGAGSDVLRAGAGDDVLFVDAEDFATGAVDGGAGFDTAFVEGETGVTVDLAAHGLEALFGGAGADTLSTSGASGVLIDGGGGNDTITGGAADDSLFGSAGDDTLKGGGGNDILDGGAGADTLRGGAGDDLYRFGRGDGRDTIRDEHVVTEQKTTKTPYTAYRTIQVWVESGEDTGYWETRQEPYTAYKTTTETVEVAKDAGTDALFLHGELGIADVLLRLSGGALEIALKDPDNPDAAFDELADRVTIENWGSDLSKIEVLAFGDGSRLDLRELVETYGVTEGGAAVDPVAAMAQAWSGTVPAGGNVYLGGSGNDVLVGGDGDDVLAGGAGHDTLVGGAGADRLEGGSGRDTLQGGDGDDVLLGGAGRDALLGGAGTDTASWAGAVSGVDANLETGIATSVIPERDILTGSWTADSASANRSGSYARFYTLTLSESATVTIDLESDIDSYLYLLKGDGTGEVVVSDDDGGGGGNARIVADLEAGTYVIEATTRASGKTGDFTLSVSGLGGDTLAGIENLEGSDHADTLTGDAGANRLDGGAGDDVLSGGGGDDVLLGGEGNDTLKGGDGDDILVGGAGSDVLDGGAGSDTASWAGAASGVNANLATGTARSTVPEPEILTGSWTPDTESWNRIGRYARFYTFTLTESATVTIDLESEVDNYLFLVKGSKTGEVVASNDDSDGSTRNARIEAHLEAGTYVVEATTYASGKTGNFTLRVSGFGSDTLAGIENLEGSDHADTLTGDAGANRLDGGAGDDMLRGGGGSDVYAFGRGYGRDTVRDEHLVSGSAQDAGTADALLLKGGIGIGDILLRMRNGALEIALKDPANPDATFDELADRVTIENWGNDFSKIEVLAFENGTRLDLKEIVSTHGVVEGGPAVDPLAAMTAAHGGALPENGEALFGTPGDDVLAGGDGDDLLIGGAGADRLDGGAGTDTVSYAASAAEVRVNLSDISSLLFVSGFPTGKLKAASGLDGDAAGDSYSGIENVEGSAHADLILGDDGANRLAGGGGADYLDGDGGDDVLEGGAGDDRLYGRAGDDVLEGGAGDDLLHGGAGADIYLFGAGDGADSIDNRGESASDDRLRFDSGIDADDLWFRQSGTDLVVELFGTGDSMTIEDWYEGADNRLDLELDDGSRLVAADVQKLVSAMALLAPPADGAAAYTDAQQTALEPVIAANWQLPAAA